MDEDLPYKVLTIADLIEMLRQYNQMDEVRVKEDVPTTKELFVITKVRGDDPRQEKRGPVVLHFRPAEYVTRTNVTWY